MEPIGEQEFEDLVKQYGTELLHICLMYLKNYQLAEDAVQETFLAVYQNYGKFKGNSSLKTWMTRIAMNKCKNILRKKYLQVECLPLDLQIPKEGEWGKIEREMTVTKAIVELPRKEREVMIAYYYQGLSVKEVAELYQLKEAAVMQRMKRARNKLKNRLEGML
ncbi:MAG: RNA polymerase sigma factor [Lachnospiraceae bacterium]|nr:RNA polymerase sigma factor [Lachnospiraceae bacterium]